MQEADLGHTVATQVWRPRRCAYSRCMAACEGGWPTRCVHSVMTCPHSGAFCKKQQFQRLSAKPVPVGHSCRFGCSRQTASPPARQPASTAEHELV